MRAVPLVLVLLAVSLTAYREVLAARAWQKKPEARGELRRPTGKGRP